MANKLLTPKQTEQLEEYGWDVVPECGYITLYQNEMTHDAWDALCYHLEVDDDREYVKVLYIGVQ